MKKIAAMAEAYDVALAPHCPLGPIALASCLQVDATSYNAFIQEQSIGIHYNTGASVLDYVNNREDFVFAGGFVNLPKLPGIGVEVNKELVLEEEPASSYMEKSCLEASGRIHRGMVKICVECTAGNWRFAHIFST